MWCVLFYGVVFSSTWGLLGMKKYPCLKWLDSGLVSKYTENNEIFKRFSYILLWHYHLVIIWRNFLTDREGNNTTYFKKMLHNQRYFSFCFAYKRTFFFFYGSRKKIHSIFLFIMREINIKNPISKSGQPFYTSIKNDYIFAAK